ncbi:MAG: L,D-transpeptidase family protein [Armatimonadota bacterium]
MTEPVIEAPHRWLRELGQVLLACAGASFVLAVIDLALYQHLTNGHAISSAGPLACVMPGPLSERILAGEAGVTAQTDPAAQPQAGGELRAALARARTRVGELVGGVRLEDVSYAALDGVADLIEAELHQASSDASATLICPSGLIEIMPLSRTARRNLRPVDLPAVPRVIDGRLYVPVRGLDQLLPVQVRYDEKLRAWRLSCGARQMSVAMPEDLFEIEIDRSSRTLTIRYAGEQLVCWSCCVGAGNNTPCGTFHIRNKAMWAPWHAYWGERIPGGSPRNPLGARWLGTSARGRETGRAIGIHGTNQPSSIGRRISGGCIRLTNQHAIEMYDTIPIGTRVVIHE